MPKHYKLKKGQLHMVKNAKMFKERFDKLSTEVLNRTLIDNNERTSDDAVAQLILAHLLPDLKSTINTNLQKEAGYSIPEDKRYKELEDLLIWKFPTLTKEIQTGFSDRSKKISKQNDKIRTKFENLRQELEDKVIFNGLDPLEAIKTLQAFKEE